MSTSRKVKHGNEDGDEKSSNKKQKKGKQKYASRHRYVTITAEYVPRTLNVVDFAEASARAFEINAMNDALERRKQAKNLRASQTLPSHLRRRAASHNVKRLPVRLREKAKEEMGTSIKISRRRKRRPGSLIDKYTHRQVKIRWLETHIWHAKRMKMIESWGYKLAEHPSEKSIKSSYRASSHLTIINDVSYFGFIKLMGEQTHLIKLFNSVTDPTLPSIGSEKYLKGKRQCSTYLYYFSKYPTHLVSPMNLIWQPRKEINDISRNILVWIHPSAFDEAICVFNEAIKYLELEKEIILKNLQTELLMFEITGPRSTALLQSVLDLDEENTRTSQSEESNQVWKALQDLRTSASLPHGVVLGLKIIDPRLSFPKKVPPRTNIISEASQQNLQEILNHWPDNVATSELWDDEKRKLLKENKISDGDLNKRRNQNLIPGQKLLPLAEDARVPIILIQRGAQISQMQQQQQRQYPSEYTCGWNIILPAGWGMALWKSFIFVGAWVGGLRERHNFHFEAGLSYFPCDYPGTKSYDEYSLQEKTKAEDAYNKHPPAKRPNYQKLFVTSPFEAPFHDLLKSNESSSSLSSKQDDEKQQQPEKIWILQGEKNLRLLNESANLDEFKERLVDQIEDRMSSSVLNKYSLDISKAVVRVRVNFLTRGVVGAYAIIYKVEKNAYDYWTKRNQSRDSFEDDQEDDDIDKKKDKKFSHHIPPDNDIIGYATTGQFSFNKGHGFAIGCCSVVAIHELLRKQVSSISSADLSSGQNSKMTIIKMGALVRKTTSMICRPASIELLQ
ncbi:6049_t:CDS:10 [Ambispora leptoticha]|uniref:6049_t:CDS:1 n=1 Tax=Ambispora leptoticha TaxID=144679 RepID=A0A9N8VV50_9GLOM|nr:6049_t:CDS:10 [Ambispora leptoticha]